MMHKVDPNKLIGKIAEKLKTEIEQPEWVPFVKTGVAKERPPVQDNWFYLRTAAILRTIEMRGPIGVSKLRVKFGSKKNNGVAPEKFRKASGNIIRKALQGLEKAGYVRFDVVGSHRGRVITSKGATLLHATAKEIMTKSE